MFRQIFVVVVAFVLGWFSHGLFQAGKDFVNPSITLPLDLLLKTDINTTFTSPSVVKKSSEDTRIQTMQSLLLEDKFFDALALYLDVSKEKQKSYLNQIEIYLTHLVSKDPAKAEEYIIVFSENEVENKLFERLQEAFIKQGKYEESMASILLEKENYKNENSDKQLSEFLHRTAEQYILHLKEQKFYRQLIIFLENMIEEYEDKYFYRFTLLELSIDLAYFEEAQSQIDILQYDTMYSLKIIPYQKILEEEQAKESYEYQIPLEKYGEHFTVKVQLDDILVILMLDTGASYTFLDKEKGVNLEVLENNIRLNTAGNEIEATLVQAKILQIGEVELEEIKITLAPFKRKGIDGLLGMNFFKRFNFYIDQEAEVLYLNSL